MPLYTDLTASDYLLATSECGSHWSEAITSAHSSDQGWEAILGKPAGRLRATQLELQREPRGTLRRSRG